MLIDTKKYWLTSAILYGRKEYAMFDFLCGMFAAIVVISALEKLCEGGTCKV